MIFKSKGKGAHWGKWYDNEKETNPYIYPKGIQWQVDEQTKAEREHPCIVYYVDPESLKEKE